MDLNKELANTQLNDYDISEINRKIKEKFNLYFEAKESAVLKKIATPAVIFLIKNITIIKFTKNGDLSIDSLYSIMKGVEEKLKSVRIRNPQSLLALFEKLIIIYSLKLEETDDLTDEEKHFAVNTALKSIKKLELSESFNINEIFPKGFAVLNELSKKYGTEKKVINNNNTKKNRKRVPTKFRAQLQQEINSKCPFCPSDDVGHFEVHHIDEVPDNNEFNNLLLVCPTCHSKITKGDISREEVVAKKNSLLSGNLKIEIYNISVNSDQCSWKPIPNTPYGFELIKSNKSPYPLIQIHFINHYHKTIVLRDVELRVKHQYSGISGLPDVKDVPKSDALKMFIEPEVEIHRIKNFNGIQIPSENASTLQLELINKYQKEYTTLDSRQILYFKLLFSNNISLVLPKILINTKDESDGTTLSYKS